MCIFALVATIGGYIAFRQRILAEENEARALFGDSLYRGEQARKALPENYPVTSLQLALAGLPADPTEPDLSWAGETAGALLEVLYSHEASVSALAASPDGERIISAYCPKALRITWVGRNQQDLIARARECLPREMTEDEKRRFYLQTD